MIRPHHQPRTPAEIMHGRHLGPLCRTAAEQGASRERSGIRLASSPDTGEAARLWEARLAAGRIGVPAPAPPAAPPGCDYGLASLARILGLPHPGRGA